MIEVSVCKGHISVLGHAGYAPPGQDIVCAAVSALVQSMILSIESLTEDKIEYSISPGSVTVKYENLSERSKTLIDSFFIGASSIAEEWSDYVRIV